MGQFGYRDVFLGQQPHRLPRALVHARALAHAAMEPGREKGVKRLESSSRIGVCQSVTQGRNPGRNAYVNGFNLGRFWSRGPQRTLYVPGPLIRQGRNVLAILELQGSATRDVRFVSGPDLGPDEK